MEIIVLGLLMLNKYSTIYELKQVVGKFLTSVSGNGTGSIQAAIKKLLNNEMIIYKEQVEKGVNKKIYSITKAGIKYFEDTMSVPMLYKEKNMELNKLFFMGFINKKKQIRSINHYIQELEKELEKLEQLNVSVSPRYAFDQTYVDNVKSNSGAPEFITKESIHDIAMFQYAMLDLGIDKIKFEIKWFQDFKEKLETEDAGDENQ